MKLITLKNLKIKIKKREKKKKRKIPQNFKRPTRNKKCDWKKILKSSIRLDNTNKFNNQQQQRGENPE